MPPVVFLYFCNLKLTDKYEIVVGLEVHAQLLTQSKIFCGDDASFGALPNTHISPVSLGHPGTLPALNTNAIDYAIKLGLALNCDINRENYFERKNYFYPDLPKGYQVTQDTQPICKNGYLRIVKQSKEKTIRFNRIHLEEDAGKSLHDQDPLFTCIDLNRAGVPLVEIVTEPDLSSADEAYAFLTELRKMLRWVGVCDGNMEQGSMRCDANISVRLAGEQKLGTRVEVKNLNSIRNVKRAIEVESARLIALAEKNLPILQQTRSYDADKNETFLLRSKEEANDYRYFPEPDLPPVIITELQISKIKSTLPILPQQLKEKYVKEYELTEYDAQVLVAEKETSDFFESLAERNSEYKTSANILIGAIKPHCNDANISLTDFPVPIDQLQHLVHMIKSGAISYNNASTKVLTELIKYPGKRAEDVARELNLMQVSDDGEIQGWVDAALASMPEKVLEYKKGKKALQGLFAGAVKKLSKGTADMTSVNKILLEKLNQ